MSGIRLVIFDMDGLMIDSEHAQRAAMNMALAPAGVQIEEAEWRDLVGRRAIEIIAHLRERYGLTTGAEELLDRKNRAYRSLIQTEITPMPGLYELVDRCRQAGLPAAVASSSCVEDICAVVRGLGLESAFVALVSGDHVRKGKPDPEIFLETARRVGVAPAQCVVLEDTAHGITAAKRAGMLGVAVPNSLTKDQDFSEADLMLESLDDVDLSALEALWAQGGWQHGLQTADV